MPRPRTTAEKEDLHHDPVNPEAYRHSVTREVHGQDPKSNGGKPHKKFVVMIQPHPDPKEPKVVPVRNGDYQLNIIRGRWFIIPQAILTVLQDARGDQIDSEGRIVGRFNSYPWSALPYKLDGKGKEEGELPFRAEVDENQDAARPIEAFYAGAESGQRAEMR